MPDVIGTWDLVSAKTTRRGDETRPYGPSPKGILVYGADGAVTVVIVSGDLGAFRSESIATASQSEAAHAFRRVLAYFGTYEVQDGTVVHRIEGSTFPNWTGRKQTRTIDVVGDHLTMSTPPIPAAAGEETTFTLVWQRRT